VPKVNEHEHEPTSSALPKVEPLLTEQEAAAVLGTTIHHLRRLRQDGMPFIRVGRFIRFRRIDLERWIENQRVEGGVS